MSSTVRMGIAAVAGVVVGLVVGYILGVTGRHSVEQSLAEAARRVSGAETSYKALEAKCESQAKAARAGQRLMHAKDGLLRALVELYANNFGLASMNLARARDDLKHALSLVEERRKKDVQDAFDKVAEAQTLAMRLDPMARVYIEKLIVTVSRIPGAK